MAPTRPSIIATKRRTSFTTLSLISSETRMVERPSAFCFGDLTFQVEARSTTHGRDRVVKALRQRRETQTDKSKIQPSSRACDNGLFISVMSLRAGLWGAQCLGVQAIARTALFILAFQLTDCATRAISTSNLQRAADTNVCPVKQRRGRLGGRPRFLFSGGHFSARTALSAVGGSE